MPRHHTPEMTLTRLRVVVDAGYLPNPPQAHLQDLRDVIDDVTALREALAWALGRVGRPRLVRRQNEAHCDAYDRAAALLGKPGSVR